MRYEQLLTDPRLQEELLDRFDEWRHFAIPRSGLEGGQPRPAVTRRDAESAIRSMSEGRWSSHGDDGGLEAIILRFTRPVYLVQGGALARPADQFPDSTEIHAKLMDAREPLGAAIPSSGRVEVANHRLGWLGTGWMVKPNVVVTNRHVAVEFARTAPGFAFRTNLLKRVMRPRVDWLHEHDQDHESIFQVKRVLWMEPDEPPDSLDVALLEIADTGDAGHPQPAVIELASASEIAVGRWMAVIGYPAQDSRNDAADQQRIFDGIYNVKRAAPGKILSVRPDGLLTHDATTLTGNSGSALIDLASGKALALHFGGLEGEANFAIQASRLQAIVDAHT